MEALYKQIIGNISVTEIVDTIIILKREKLSAV